MKRKGVMLMILLVPMMVWAVDAPTIAMWLEAPSAKVEDAVWLVESLESPDRLLTDIDWKKYPGLSPQATLTAGALARILILAGKIQPGWFYRITGWERYALSSAQYAGVMAADMVTSQVLRGSDMVAVIGKLK